MPQTSVSLNPSRGADGQLSHAAPHFADTCICDEATGIPFGRAVTLKTAGTKEVDLPASSGEASASRGVAVRDMSLSTNDGEFADGDEMSVLRHGVIYVQVEDAVTCDATPFIRFAAGATLTALGRFRSDDGDEGGGALAAARTGWKYLESGAAGEYVRVLVTV